MRQVYRKSVFSLVLMALAACSWQAPSTPSMPTTQGHETVYRDQNRKADMPVHQRAAALAASQVGVPYRYGGRTPAGFDCSGLVWYSYQQHGITMARTTKDLFRTLTRVPTEEMRSGDVLFFDIAGKPSHVGVYLGNGTFVHAPSTGKAVSILPVEHRYYRPRLVAVGRP